MRRSKRWPWLLVPFLVAGLGKDNTGEFRAVVQEASDLTPPPSHVQNFMIKPEVFERPLVAPPTPKPKPRPRPHPRRQPKPQPEAPRVLTRRQQILQAARNLLGIPYVWGGDSRSGLDCSGFTMLAYAAVGIHLPHLAVAQTKEGVRVSKPLPGDLVYWSWPSSHVMLYYGGGLVIGAHHSGTVSSISPLWGSPTFYRLV